MEQRVDPNIKLEYAAGTDPAYIPGLTGPGRGGTEDRVPEQADDAEADTAVPQDTVLPSDGLTEGTAEDSGPDTASEEETGAGDAEKDEAGPVFEVSDRRGSIRADRDGILFRLDDQEADFRWDEIGAVEVKPARFGRRFTVTVHLSTRRWFDAEVEAAARSQLSGWSDELDAVLDVYFEES
ncbi:hypothetical protein [Streptomyces sp. NBC_00829]|uniref:hypothetical protein n=1 Tax=Streptomyces sp. NBC_00829 TaxID=2903679 RepID=UPI00386904B1|nr:hypothetical protein OG293_02465 [Streptomyces sp. NBC_00829]